MDADSLPFALDIAVQEPGWNALWPEGVEPPVARAIKAGLSVLDAAPEGELSVALVSDQEIAALNKTYRNKDGATNVLSFPAPLIKSDPAPVQGDIVVALQTVLREASMRGIPARDHATHLLVHGFLHLQGYDHMDKADADIMEALEVRALQTLNIADPYKLAS